MSNEVAHKSWWQIFEVVFGIPFLVAIGLQRALPLAWSRGSLAPVFILAGTLFIVVGITVIVLARREFSRYGQPTDPGLPTRELITMGVFSISRNPLYLGGVCILLGISLALDLPWVLLLLLPSIVAGHYILIAPEERYLAATFGEKYDLYTATVHRWFGRKRRLG